MKILILLFLAVGCSVNEDTFREEFVKTKIALESCQESNNNYRWQNQKLEIQNRDVYIAPTTYGYVKNSEKMYDGCVYFKKRLASAGVQLTEEMWKTCDGFDSK